MKYLARVAVWVLLMGLAVGTGWAKDSPKTTAKDKPKAEAPAQEAAPAPDVVRKPILAGLWYPAASDELSAMVKGFLDQAHPAEPRGRILALVAPHAGYPFSGPTAAFAYKLVAEKPFDTVVVVAPSHHIGFPGVSVYDQGGFETPLGVMPLDQDFINRLKKADPTVEYFPLAHSREHSIEVQIPFLQTVLPKARLVPLVMGDQGSAAVSRLGAALAKTVSESRGKAVLLVASSDLSHYHGQDQARAMDERVRASIQAFSAKDLAACLGEGTCEACGGGPVLAVMQAAQALGATQGKVLAMADSSLASGDTEAVVGYLAAALIQPEAQAPPPGQAGGQTPGQLPGQTPAPGPGQPKPALAPTPAAPAKPVPAAPTVQPQGLAPELRPITRMADFSTPWLRPAQAFQSPGFVLAQADSDQPPARKSPAKPRARPRAKGLKPGQTYTNHDRARLLALAREAIVARLSGRNFAAPADLPKALLQPRGAFVTLSVKSQLRGCIGTLAAKSPLHLTVAAMAQAAAFEDPRFPPLTPADLGSLEIEISVLSPITPLPDPDQVEVGRHGLVVQKGQRMGLLLPQVAREFAFDRRQFLEAVCEKAGLAPGCWKDPAAKLSVFTAEVF